MLDKLRKPRGATRKRKRVGRGESSGYGKTAGRGGKGQTARTGKGKPGWGFEGGQMPMYRRMPKRGDTNPFAKKAAQINVGVLARYFKSGETVNQANLRALRLMRRTDDLARILGSGQLLHPLILEGVYVSKGAQAKIIAAGGTVRPAVIVQA